LFIFLFFLLTNVFAGISSPSQPLDIDIDGRQGKIKLGKSLATLDEDLIILIGTSEPFVPRLWVEPIKGIYTTIKK
jgi:hypothetical protein